VATGARCKAGLEAAIQATLLNPPCLFSSRSVAILNVCYAKLPKEAAGTL
jgi:hypothetical protein